MDKLRLSAPPDTSEVRYRKMPIWVTVPVIFCIYFAAMGDWKVLNIALGGLPKVVSLGVAGIALLNLLITADFKEFKKAAEYLPILLLLLVVICTFSLLIWSLSFTPKGEMIRGSSKLVFQFITVLLAVCLVYLYDSDAVDVLFWGIVMANGSIMVIEALKSGISESIKSLITCIVTFGEASGFVRELELHDITFLFGQFLIYYICFAKHGTDREKRLRILKILISIFFLLLGLKRSTFAAVFLVVCMVVFIRMMNNKLFWIMLVGTGLFAVSWGYMYVVWNGSFLRLMARLNVDMMGREDFWEMARAYYQFSPTFLGRGFEAETAIITSWYKAGLINHLYPFHNNFLKMFVELGFWGFASWVGIQTFIYPLYWGKKHGNEAALLYIALFTYMFVTYLTDNTAFYFWDSIGLRLMPMALSYRYAQMKVSETAHWRPREKHEIMAQIKLAELKMSEEDYE